MTWDTRVLVPSPIPPSLNSTGGRDIRSVGVPVMASGRADSELDRALRELRLTLGCERP
jgi:hypothetical protein